MSSELIVSLLLILTVSWILGYIFSRFGLPVLLGELLAGVLLGPPILGIITHSPSIELIAEFGIFFVMFHTGMELDPKELLEHIWASLAVALGGFVLPFILGFLTTRIFGGTFYQSLFVGMGVSISAIAVQAVILHSMRLNKSAVGHIIIGAAIVDNILTLIAMSTLLGLANTGSFQIQNVLIVLINVIGFFTLTIIVGYFIIPRFAKRLTDEGGKAFTFALLLALLMAYFAEKAGLHLIIGAFLAGQFVRKDIMDERIYKLIGDRFFGISYGFLVPIFFASLSFHLHLSSSLSFILFSFVLIVVAILGKLIGCGIGAIAFRYNLWESAVIGLGMNGRGAVELVVAMVIIRLSDQLLSSGVINSPLLTQDQFSGLVLMAFVTTIIAPVSMRWAFNRSCLPTEKAGFCELWDKSRDI